MPLSTARHSRRVAWPRRPGRHRRFASPTRSPAARWHTRPAVVGAVQRGEVLITKQLIPLAGQVAVEDPLTNKLRISAMPEPIRPQPMTPISWNVMVVGFLLGEVVGRIIDCSLLRQSAEATGPESPGPTTRSRYGRFLVSASVHPRADPRDGFCRRSSSATR